MAAVVEVEVGGGAVGERELDEVRVRSRGETQPETERRRGEVSRVIHFLGEAGSVEGRS